MSNQDKCRYLLTAAKKLKLDGDISWLQYDILKEMILSFDDDLYADPSLATTKYRLSKYTRQLYDALFENLSLEKAHIIATTYDEISDADTRALVYGEVDFESFAEVLHAATSNTKRCCKFVDLGHGTGRAVIVAALLCNFKECYGIEILKGLQETSLDILNRFNCSIAPLLSTRASSIHFLHGSFLSESHDWSDADLVFANSTCFPDELIGQIEVLARKLAVGARVVTFTSSLRSEYFKIIFKKRLFMSWGPATVYIHERIADGDVVRGIVDKFDRPTVTHGATPGPSNVAMSLSDVLASLDEKSMDSDSQFSTVVIPPVHTDDSSSLATTPSNTVTSSFSTSTEWEPDTPTLKAWARHELRMNGGEGGDIYDRMHSTRPARTNSLSSSDAEEEVGEDEGDADDENTDGFDDYRGEDFDFSSLHISRLAFKSKENGVIYADDDDEGDNYDYDDEDEYGDEDDVIDTRVERYFHVADDSEEEDDDVEDELFDDSS